jgi:CRP/FNR family cyclic AMP-dependent transcriptional regulator
MAGAKDTQQIKKIGLFSGLDDEQLSAIADIASKRSFPKNAIIINEGDETDSLYLILSGKVKVVLSDEDGKEVIISILEPGAYFGELSLIDDEPRSARVVTMADCQFSIIHKSDFRRVMETNPSLVINLLKGLTERLRAANKNIESLALMDVYGRVARTLLQFSEEDGDKRIIKEKLTQKDIANMVGASREMVSRIFKDLTTGGYVSIESGIITINDKLPTHY